MSYLIKWDHANVIVTFSDELTYNEIQQVNNVIYGDKRFDRMRYQIADFSQVTKFLVSESDAEVAGQLDKSSSVWNNEIKSAIVTTDPDFIEMSQAYKKRLSSTNWEVEIFDTIEDAIQWCKE